MPDNMSPEQSSIDAFRSLGQPAQLPGAEETARAAEQFPQPEAQKGMPDIRLQAVDPEEQARREREMWEETSRMSRGSEYDSGRAVETALARHSDPETVLEILRDHILNNETFKTNVEQRKDFRVQHLADTLQDREEAFRRPLTLLVERGLVQLLNEEDQVELRGKRGGALPIGYDEKCFGTTREVGGHAIKEGFSLARTIPESYRVEKIDPQTHEKVYQPVTFRRIEIPVAYFGTPEQRKEISSRFEGMRHELNLRHDIVNAFGVMMSIREALFKLTEAMYFRSSISAEGMGKLFNLQSQKDATSETVTGVKVNSLGDKIDTALRLLYLNSICEKKTKVQALIKKPGFKQFLFPGGENDPLFKEWVGDPSGWTEEVRLDEKIGKITGGSRTKDDIVTEREDGRRKKLVMKNIFAETNTYFEGELFKAIDKFLGAGQGNTETEKFINKQEAEAARRIAYRLFRLLLTADVEGYEIYKKPGEMGGEFDPIPNYEIVYENGPAASDYGKLTKPWLYVLKSYRKGRDASPMISLYHSTELYQKLISDFFRQTSFKTLVPTTSGDGKYSEERSVFEVMWGNEAGGRVPGTGHAYLQEDARRLGELPWTGMNVGAGLSEDQLAKIKEAFAGDGLPVGGLPSEILHAGIYLTGFMGGREGGIFDLITQTGIRLSDLEDEGFWRKLWKMLDVGTKKGIGVNGEFKGKTTEEINKPTEELKINVIVGFLKGVQGLNQWQQLQEEERKVAYRNKRNETSHEFATSRILRVAREALIEQGVVIKEETWQELAKRK